jgi:hypothetical protein
MLGNNYCFAHRRTHLQRMYHMNLHACLQTYLRRMPGLHGVRALEHLLEATGTCRYNTSTVLYMYCTVPVSYKYEQYSMR